MADGALVPEIRFKGFTEPWKEYKLGEIAHTTIGEFVIRTRQNPNSPYPVYNGGTSFTGFYDEYNNEANQIVISARGANAGFVNIVRRRFWGGNSCYAVGLCDKDRFDLDFTYQAVKNNQSAFIENQQAANIPSVSKKDVEMFVFYGPDFIEQNLTGAFFHQLDSLITLHQCKCDKLRLLKGSMLEKMFPKPGCDVPEVRFDGFTGPWEQRKLGEVCTRYDKQRVPVAASERMPGSTPYYGANGVQDYVSGYTHKGEFVLVAEDGASDLADYPVQIIDGLSWVNNHAHVIQADVDVADNRYLLQAIKSLDISSFLVGGTRAKLNAEVMMNLELMTPGFHEQCLVGSFFAQLDDLITHHQRKLEALKKMKSAMLSKMFV